MGNSSTKEQRPPLSPSQSHAPGVRHPRSHSVSSGAVMTSQTNPPDQEGATPYASRHGRGGRSDLSFLGIGGSSNDSDTVGLESRRETKQEREARKAEKERLTRAKERERSMREEGVDGGYLVTQGVYTGPEDFNKAVVRQLMIERRLAPFFKGLNDYSNAWRDDQLVAAVRGQPIPAEAENTIQGTSGSVPVASPTAQSSDKNPNNDTVDISSRSQSSNLESSLTPTPSHPAFLSPYSNTSNGPPTPSIFRPRSKTLASLTTLSKHNSHGELIPQEIQIPTAPALGGRSIEALLYQDAAECPICFLYYPNYLNRTRCCDQPICSECFVQIKRAEPHPPEHTDPAAPGPSGLGLGVNGELGDSLISEPAACPFCVEPELGVTYEPPPFRTGLAYANHPSSHPLANATSAMSSSSSLSSFSGAGNGSLHAPSTGSRRRTTSISANSPGVITTDRIRPDWAQKLANARAHAARRSATATALHTAAYLMSGVSSLEGRGFAAGFRRNRTPRGSGSDGPLFTTRSLLSQRGTETDYVSVGGAGEEGSPGRGGSAEASGSYGEPNLGLGRRTRLDDLEDMMMMEAIRLSLLSEEERKRKEEKEAKKKDKESKRTGKTTETHLQISTESDNAQGLSEGSTSASPSHSDDPALDHGKGKGVKRRAVTPPNADVPASTTMASGSSLRPQTMTHQVSNSSSTATSFVDSAAGSVRNGFHGSTSSFEASAGASAHNKVGGSKSEDITRASTPPMAGGSGPESMFNFRSLAAMIGDDDDPRVEESRQGEPTESQSTKKIESSSTERSSGPNLVWNHD
ncbi:MAG: SNF1-interacting protein [Peltula sp. TS41687]|nr:MAG: SNF1-interacting protein [Peltula sp. TS41687]